MCKNPCYISTFLVYRSDISLALMTTDLERARSYNVTSLMRNNFFIRAIQLEVTPVFDIYFKKKYHLNLIII